MDHCELSHTIRNLAIELLSDASGINEDAVECLKPLLEEYGHTDILEILIYNYDRYYITLYAVDVLRCEQ